MMTADANLIERVRAGLKQGHLDRSDVEKVFAALQAMPAGGECAECRRRRDKEAERRRRWRAHRDEQVVKEGIEA